jgi:hypothetical protein
VDGFVPALFESLHENRLTFAGMLVKEMNGPISLIHDNSVSSACGGLVILSGATMSGGEIDSLRSRLLTRGLTLPTPPAQFIVGAATYNKTFLLYANSITQPAQLCFEPFFLVAPTAKHLFCL